jgi:acyl-CoA reductase-like NAD-dependent aldehyde dehydrogenase
MERRLKRLHEHLCSSSAAAAAEDFQAHGFALPRLGCLIDNEWVKTSTSHAVNAWDGTLIAEVAVAGENEVNAAVSSCRKAFKTWKRVAPLDRTAIINKFADLVEENAEQLAQLECLELGKPITDARGGVVATLKTYRYYAGYTDKFMGELPPNGTPGFHTQVMLVPVGVVGAIVPWNYPVLEMAKIIGPCLATGCCCVYKTNEYTPLNVLRCAELLIEAGMPPGVVNFVNGTVPTGELISNHMDIDKVFFTGSVRAGKAIAQAAAASNLKGTCLELGGKSPHIVFPDCEDLDAVAANVLAGFSGFMGQACCAGTRVYVHQDIYGMFVDKVAALARDMAASTGSPTSDATLVGPLANPTQFERVSRYLEIGKQEARLVCGGEVRDVGTGAIVPTIFADVPDDATIMREEIFGPVGCFASFDSIEEVVERANDSPYGLAAGIWSSNINTCLTLAENLDAGTVWVNGMMSSWGYQAPFGGPKQTGGGRTNGKQGLEEYLITKTVSIQIGSGGMEGGGRVL